MSLPPETNGAKTGERIAKLLARAGVASRREVERMIAEGRVTIGDEVVTTPATVLAGLKGVSVDGKPVRAAEAARLFLFHKPSGLITAERDPAGRSTIYTALRNALPPGTPRMMPVGRLDLNTEGLLLLTNDGELKRALELPSSGVPRTYRARTFGEISQEQLEGLIEGVTIEGMNYGRIDANLERRTGRNQWIELTLTEGKNREVRRVLEHLGLQVSRLLRTAYGPFELLDLPRGAAVEIRQVDVERFVKSLKAGAVDMDFKPKSVVLEARPATRAEAEMPPSPPRSSPSGGGGRRAAADGGGADKNKRPAKPRPLRQPVQGTAHPERPARRPAEGAATSPKGGGSVKPAPQRKNRDRGEKLIDRPKPTRARPAGPKPAGWARAKPRGKPGNPRK